jgi:hypothetical protein
MQAVDLSKDSSRRSVSYQIRLRLLCSESGRPFRSSSQVEPMAPLISA